ncbi:hypothetical protein SEA_IBANTIK_105 [Streptomyces phage Ibantik]|uniref:Uncharacterized protein n=1 Tax=Streptomyces phage Ibantik TaxID=2182397 RepID=A0A2U8UPH1_9CAUD|nr:hypothetical protein QEH36_gp060 [Streptomyces phage Ibantik]AWN05326.1 hypothetical protein SEA_IBANTIK_105 [Streptomyces phage Ibantik]
MPGRAISVEVTYGCDDCGEEFTIEQNIIPTVDSFTLPTTEEHEDCEY